MSNRPLCKECNFRPSAVNYIRNEIRYYRSTCAGCIRRKQTKKPAIPNWKRAGYKKKMVCERCGFKGKYLAQLFVFYIDGNQNNVAWGNFRTVCANCQIEVALSGLSWAPGDLIPDF